MPTRTTSHAQAGDQGAVSVRRGSHASKADNKGLVTDDDIDATDELIDVRWVDATSIDGDRAGDVTISTSEKVESID